MLSASRVFDPNQDYAIRLTGVTYNCGPIQIPQTPSWSDAPRWRRRRITERDRGADRRF